MLLSLFVAKSIYFKIACIEIAKSFCTRSTYTSNTFTKYIYIKNDFFAINSYIKGAGSDNIDIKSASKKSACARNVCTIKLLKIHLQFFSILEIKLFDTS